MRHQHVVLICFLTLFVSAQAHGASVFDGIEAATQYVSLGYRVAPALMLGLMMLCAIPILASIVWLQEVAFAPPDTTRRYQRFAGWVTSIDTNADEVPVRASVELLGAGERRFAILHDMLRIGREDDNDIRIASASVQRYHAAIYREDFGDYYITDLSGPDGKGIVVNGRRCGNAHLHDGDIIELGPGRMRFRAGFI